MTEKRFDILVVGAGLSGLLTAYALSLKGVKVAIIDKNDFCDSKNINFDFRTTAISEGSKLFLEKIDFWQKVSKYAEPIKKINVFDRKKTNKIEFENQEKNSFLGYIVENKYLKNSLIENLKNKKNVFLFPKSVLGQIVNSSEHINATVNKVKIKSKLLIAADGKNSFVGKITKMPIFKKNYKHQALVINLSHKDNHNNIAYEIFSKKGPLAILPMKSKNKKNYRSSIVWSNEKQFLNNITRLEDTYFTSLLNEHLSEYIGEVKNIYQKRIFNLSAHINSKFFSNNIVYIGDSAHSIHPIAGQGWNLAVRDIENLVNSLQEGLSLGLDIGDDFIGKNYNNLSFKNSFLMYQITDKLNSIFLLDRPIINNIRKIGFSIINNNKRLNNIISSFAMGKY